MLIHNSSEWTHAHIFDSGNASAERSTRMVMWITILTMTVEILSGWWFNSMALLADGWHMGSHAFAIGLSAFAYAAARKHASDPRFAFGTWKIEILGGFASSMFLMGVAALMVFESVSRLVTPHPISYREALVVAVAGLLVNLGCSLILGGAHNHHRHEHEHEDSDGHHHHHHDLNLRAAYIHVVTDAATSVLAIIALTCGWIWGWDWMDALMGIAGAMVIIVWARGLLLETSKVLLDREMDHPVVSEIREVIEKELHAGDTRVADLHVWRVGRDTYACAISLVTHDTALTPKIVREHFAQHSEIVHSTIEIQICASCDSGDGA